MTQKKHHDVKKPYHQFIEVNAENFTTNSNLKWLPGRISKPTGPLSYIIELVDGNTVRRHDELESKVENNDKVIMPTGTT